MAWFQYISILFNLAYIKNKFHKTLDYWYRDILNFGLIGKGLAIVSPPHFVHDFSRKMFLELYFINWPNFIVWLPLLLEILGIMCIAIVCFSGFDVLNFEVKLIFLIKPWPKIQYKNLNTLRTKRTFKEKWKAFPTIFKGLLVPKIVAGRRVRL